MIEGYARDLQVVRSLTSLFTTAVANVDRLFGKVHVPDRLQLPLLNVVGSATFSLHFVVVLTSFKFLFDFSMLSVAHKRVDTGNLSEQLRIVFISC